MSGQGTRLLRQGTCVRVIHLAFLSSLSQLLWKRGATTLDWSTLFKLAKSSYLMGCLHPCQIWPFCHHHVIRERKEASSSGQGLRWSNNTCTWLLSYMYTQHPWELEYRLGCIFTALIFNESPQWDVASSPGSLSLTLKNWGSLGMRLSEMYTCMHIAITWY